MRYLTAIIFLALTISAAAQEGEAKRPPKPEYAGSTEKGVLLPNGWRLTPAGQQVPLTDLPLSILVSSDGSHAFVATSGYNAHELTVVDLATRNVLAKETVSQSWFGLALDTKTERLWWSGGGEGSLHHFGFRDGKLSHLPSPLPKPETQPDGKVANSAFRTGVHFDARSGTLYSLAILPHGGTRTFAWGDEESDNQAGGTISRLAAGKESEKKDASKQENGGKDADKNETILTVSCGKRPYDVVLARNGLLYVSDWADRRLLVVDPETLRTISRISVDEHPNQLALHPTDDRLFVACASSNTVSVVDTLSGTVEETIVTSLFPLAPEGSTPDALCVSPDGKTLFVANADNNCIAVVDIDVRRKSGVKGFIPTGWYPTSVAITPNGRQLLVGVGKGNRTLPNNIEGEDKKPAPGEQGKPFRYIGTTLSGSLSIVDIPDDPQLAAYTDQVYRNCPYSDALLTATGYTRKTAIPAVVGEPSPIKHVIYIIKENRTYDQVFSDLPRGNGDPSLLLFGEEVTPNHHKLATEFVLLDNLYCNGHVSADGHPWSTMAYNTDYIARNWALTYSSRKGIHDDDDGDLSNAPSGYLWDACKRNGLTYRSYGVYGGRVSQSDGTFRMEGRVPGLVGHTCPKYKLDSARKAGEEDRVLRDTENVDVFLEEFREFEKNDNLPNFIVMALGEDHTYGTQPGKPTPVACVASNDLALGKLVEAVTQSKYWPETAIFVIEDDAQDGPDHVDSHRTLGLVISPYCRRNHLDSTQYSTCSMIRTMELILGLPPLSQYDAAATPMYESFADSPNLTPYRHEPPRIKLDSINTSLAYGAERSSKMDFSEYDRIDDHELNEILWRAIKGADAPIPPAVRRAIAYRPAESAKEE